ncbi:MAG: hypothetical protein ACYSYM_16110 [Planctomycetota bacterium]|jgi:hypothetical protein
MSKENDKSGIVETRPPLQKGAIAAFVAFFILGFGLAQPCLCRAGAVVGFYKSIFYLIVVLRLLYGIVKRNLKQSDFLLWVGGFITFCVVAECLH